MQDTRRPSRNETFEPIRLIGSFRATKSFVAYSNEHVDRFMFIGAFIGMALSALTSPALLLQFVRYRWLFEGPRPLASMIVAIYLCLCTLVLGAVFKQVATAAFKLLAARYCSDQTSLAASFVKAAAKFAQMKRYF